MKTVAVVGGGFAGISSAFYASRKGYKVILIEKSTSLGGRWHGVKGGFDNGQHLLSGAYKGTLHILEELNCSKYFKSTGALKVNFCEDGRQFLFDTSIFPGKVGQLLALLKLKGLSIKSKIGILNFITSLLFNKINSQNKSCLEILKEYQQTEEAIIRFWKPIIVSALNGQPEDISAELLLLTMKKGFFGTKADSALIYPTVPIVRVFEKIKEELSKSCEVRLSTKIVNISKTNYYELETSKGEKILADEIISAVSYPQFKKLFPDIAGSFGSFNNIQFSSIVSASMIYSKHFTDYMLNALLGTKAEWLFDKTRMMDNNRHKQDRHNFEYAITTSSAEAIFSLKSPEIAELFDYEIRRIFPKSKDAKLIDYHIFREKSATPLLTSTMQNQRPKPQKINGIIISGDWVNTGYPATIEGAVLSGIRAVDRL